MTTRFKKFNRVPVTKIVRKKYARRKHRTNWLRLSYITKSWVFFFIRSKQFVRFYQSLGLFNTQSFSTSTLLVTKKFADIVTHRGFNTFSCSHNILQKFKSQGTSSKYYVSPLPYSRSEGLSTRLISDLPLIENINPGLVNHDNLLYPYNFETNLQEEYSELQQLIPTQLFTTTLNYTTTVYKILITITLLHF